MRSSICFPYFHVAQKEKTPDTKPLASYPVLRKLRMEFGTAVFLYIILSPAPVLWETHFEKLMIDQVEKGLSLLPLFVRPQMEIECSVKRLHNYPVTSPLLRPVSPSLQCPV